MKKILIYILVVAIIIALGITVGISIGEDEKAVPTTSGKTENKTDNKMENTIENKLENNVVENEKEDEPPENGEPDKVDEPKTDLEKAIDIAKKEWGTDSTVKYVDETEENAPEGEFIICIREKSTTKALIWYKININDGTCEEW